MLALRCRAAWSAVAPVTRALHSSIARHDSAVDIFDGRVKALHRDRAARSGHIEDPLLDEVADRLLDRLNDCARTFESVLVLGGACVQVADRLRRSPRGIQEITYVDTSQGMLDLVRARGVESGAAAAPKEHYIHWTDTVDEILPVEPYSYDAVIACLGLHWINNVPGVLAQCRLALRPDRVFLGALLGGSTLQELRISCSIAQQERSGGISPRLSPLAQVRDAGNLLTRAGLSLPSVDVDDIEVQYSDCLGLVRHLRMMGETTALKQRLDYLPRDHALATAAVYHSLFREGKGDDAGVPATFQVVYITGWSPDPSQPRAARRGSATVSLEDLQRDLARQNPAPDAGLGTGAA